MVLPTSGAISMSDLNTEMGRTSTASISLNDDEIRRMARQYSGAINMNTLHSKARGTLGRSTGTLGATAGTSPNRYRTLSGYTFTGTYTFTTVTDVCSLTYEGTNNQILNFAFGGVDSQAKHNWIVANLKYIVVDGITYSVTWNSVWDNKYFSASINYINIGMSGSDSQILNIGWRTT